MGRHTCRTPEIPLPQLRPQNFTPTCSLAHSTRHAPHQLEEESEGNLQQCFSLQAENVRLKAKIAALEAETSHRCVYLPPPAACRRRLLAAAATRPLPPSPASRPACATTHPPTNSFTHCIPIGTACWTYCILSWGAVRCVRSSRARPGLQYTLILNRKRRDGVLDLLHAELEELSDAGALLAQLNGHPPHNVTPLPSGLPLSALPSSGAITPVGSGIPAGI